jgi:hypothetical protein
MIRGLHTRRVALLVLLPLVVAGVASAADWPDVTAAERALAKPRIDPNADAEVLFWEVRITDSERGDDVEVALEHHLRIKVFTDRGRESEGKVELPYTSRERVRDVRGRTITPDGRIVELRSEDIFDRSVVEADGFKLKAKTFVLPGVVPGAIIEYRWREVRDNQLANDLELAFQRNIPAHAVRYYIKPLVVRELGYQMRVQPFNFQNPPPFQKADGGYAMVEARDIPALRREPLMAPELALKPWMLVYYADLATVDRPVERFWQEYGRDAYGAYKPLIRVTGPIRTAALDVTKAATSVEQKIDALMRDVRTRIKRTDVGDAPIGRQKGNKNTGDTFSRAQGDGRDVTLLFVAMASAAGLESRLALLPDRSEFLSQPSMKQPYFIRHLAVAVRDGQDWRFLDPAHLHTRGGHLAWRQEGQYALLLDERTPEFVSVAVASPALSSRTRTLALKVLDDGTLEGDVRLEYTGHVAVPRRENDVDETPAERERSFTEDFVKRLPGAQLSNVVIENSEKPDDTYTIRFSLRVPGYGQRTGTRMFVQPALVQRGAEAVFSAANRQTHVYFPYAWSEQDTVTIQLPAGYTLEAGNAPETLSLGDGGEIGLYAVKISQTSGVKSVTYSRTFSIGGGGRILFPPTEYASLKGFFDAVSRSDGYALTLRKESAGDAK